MNFVLAAFFESMNLRTLQRCAPTPTPLMGGRRGVQVNSKQPSTNKFGLFGHDSRRRGESQEFKEVVIMPALVNMYSIHSCYSD